jgi:hypothetical protein
MLQSTKDEFHRKTLENIEKYGLSVQYVFDNEENFQFSYSIGLYQTYQHPEIIIIGLEQELMHVVINNLAEDIKNGKRHEAYSWSPDVLDDFECYFIEVDKSNYDEYVLGDIRLYGGNNFPLLQCIYPTLKGIYPWEKEWPEEIKNLQPILGDLNLS